MIFQFTDPGRDLDVTDGDSGHYENKNNPHKEKIEALEQIHEGERIKPSFFQEMGTHFEKKRIYLPS